MPGLIKWKYFWIFWGSGMAIFLTLVAWGGALQTDVAPGGVLDHQSAATAERGECHSGKLGRSRPIVAGTTGNDRRLGLYPSLFHRRHHRWSVALATSQFAVTEKTWFANHHRLFHILCDRLWRNGQPAYSIDPAAGQ